MKCVKRNTIQTSNIHTMLYLSMSFCILNHGKHYSLLRSQPHIEFLSKDHTSTLYFRTKRQGKGTKTTVQHNSEYLDEPLPSMTICGMQQ